MNSEGSLESSNIQAEGNGIAIGGLSVGGDIRIGHTIGYTQILYPAWPSARMATRWRRAVAAASSSCGI
jgi:hypothetical protein